MDSKIGSSNNKVKFITTRFGNVLGSKGSIIPFFSKLIKENKKILITDKSMTRFWINYDDAVKLVLNSLMSSKAFETYVPMLKSMKILDLVNIMKQDAKLEIIGIKKGEKIHEELISSEESAYTKKKKNYYIINLNNKANNKKIFDKQYNSSNFLVKKLSKNYLEIIKTFI